MVAIHDLSLQALNLLIVIFRSSNESLKNNILFFSFFFFFVNSLKVDKFHDKVRIILLKSLKSLIWCFIEI